MKKLILNGIDFISKASEIEDNKLFCDAVHVFVSEEGSVGVNSYFVKVASTKWIENETEDGDESIYFGQAVIVHEYDQDLIYQSIQKIIDVCNESNTTDKWACLSEYMDYEDVDDSERDHTRPIVSSIDLPNTKNWSVDKWEDFNFTPSVEVKDKSDFTVNVVSVGHLQKQRVFFARRSIVLRYYDEQLISDRVNTIVNSVKFVI